MRLLVIVFKRPSFLDIGMRIREISENKLEFLHLLLLADEQREMIDKYIDRGTMYVLEDDGIVKGQCIVTDEGAGILEIQSLSVDEIWQGRGYGRLLIEHVAQKYRGRFSVLQVGTGDSPLTVPFYEHCGFTVHHIIKDYFPEHYDHPIFEGGRQLKDKVYLRRNMNM